VRYIAIESCEKCPKRDVVTCSITKKTIKYSRYDKIFPEWCPLLKQSEIQTDGDSMEPIGMG